MMRGLCPRARSPTIGGPGARCTLDMYDHSLSASTCGVRFTLNKYIEKRRKGEVAEKDTQTEMQAFPRQPFSRQLLLASPGVLVILGEMSEFTLDLT